MSDLPPAGERRLSPTVIVIVVAVVAVLIAVGVGVALTRRSVPPVKPGSDTVHAGTQQTSGIPGLASAGSGSGASSATASGTSSATKAVHGSNPATVPPRPTAPAPKGSKVTTISAPPEHTIGMLVVPKGFAGAAYDVTFQPYGWGPGGQQGGSLVIRVVSAQPADANAKKLNKPLAGRTMMVYVLPTAAKVVKVGGAYSGRLFLRPQADVGVFYLEKAALK